MDFDLPELLTHADASQSSPLAASIRRMLNLVNVEVPALPESHGAKFNVPGAQLVWLVSQYTAAAAASHGLQLSYLEDAGEQSLQPHLPALSALLPTSTVVNFTRRGQPPEAFVGGGEQSDFEKHDIKFLSHEGGLQSNRSLALIVNLNGVKNGKSDWVYAAISAQLLIAYVCVIRDIDAPSIVSVDQSPEWTSATVRLGDIAVDVYRNSMWAERIGALKDLRFKEETGAAGAYASTMRVRLVAANEFPDLTQTGSFPEETIAGAVIHIYGSTEAQICSYQAGRLNPQKTPERRFYECRNVNLSCGDLIWRDDISLFDRGMTSRSHLPKDELGDYRLGGSVGVSPPTTRLEGTYFLAPTILPHHSHLIFETLRRLSVAERYKGSIKLLASDILTPTQRDYFHVFGFKDEDCVYRGLNETVHVERLVFTLEEPHLYDRYSIEYLRRLGLRYYTQPHAKNERIYFSRKDVRKYRNLVNETEVEEVFKKFGFAILLASDLSAEEKVDLMSTAKFVAGPLGAAHCYMPFSLDGELIALTSDLYFPGSFHEVSGLRAKDIHYIKGLGLKFFSDPWRYEHSSFYLDPELLATALTNILRHQ
jgi:hypothetical protein